MTRTDRYADLLPLDRLQSTACTVIGVGAIGRQVGLQLAALGAARIQLVDPELVESVNLGPQGFLEADVARPKVDATAQLMQQINAELAIEVEQRRFTRGLDVHAVVFCCVDSIETRRFIWDSVHDFSELLVDARMAAEVLRVLSVSDSRSRERYPGSLFGPGDALQAACTARSTIYCANVAAAMMVHQFTRWLRRMPTDFDVLLNLLSMEITVE
jgi:hypothetical protein